MKRLILLLTIGLVSGCAATAYTTAGPGTVDYDGLKVQTGRAWNIVPPQAMPTIARRGSTILTQDGTLLDRVMVIPGVPDGESLFGPPARGEIMPVFKANMLPNEIEELTEASLTKLYGEGNASVQTSNLRPHRFGDNNGFLFDMNIALSDGPDYRGVTGAFVAAEKLYLVFYLGAEPYYYEKHLNEALALIKGAQI